MTLMIWLLMPMAWAAPNDPSMNPTANETANVCAAEPPDRLAPYASELNRARSLYRRGCHAWALDLLRALDIRRRLEPVDLEQTIEQRKYLGEVLLVLGKRQQAEDTFRLLLIDHPEVEMGLLLHDPAAVDLFEQVRASIRTEPNIEEPSYKLPRRPLKSYLPLGAGHFQAGRTRQGTSMALIQGAFLVGAWTTAITAPRGPWSTRDEAKLRRANRFRAVNISLNVGFLTSYIVSQRAVQKRWRAENHSTIE